ncbi:MAG: DNA alkylation repair protein [Planctomycetota bacterium]
MSHRAEKSFSLADELFNRETLGKLSAGLANADAKFDRKRFERRVLARFPELELKQRIEWIVEALEDHLPAKLSQAIPIFRKAMPPKLDPKRTDDDFGEFIWIVPGEYVARHGCTSQDMKRSLTFLRYATQRFTSENAIRPFLSNFQDETLRFVHECADDQNYHVRRFASEGIRPYLPWAMRVLLPTAEILAVLDRLYADPTRYVTRSVSNTLNDISRCDADTVLETLDRWKADGRQSADELRWMTNHALRTLVREDYAPALERLGFPSRPKFRISKDHASADVKVGETFERSATLHSLEEQKLKIGLRVHFLKSNGTHSAKLFKIADVDATPNQRIPLEKRQPFRPLTTRALYPGTHYSEWIVNGVSRGKKPFELLD